MPIRIIVGEKLRSGEVGMSEIFHRKCRCGIKKRGTKAGGEQKRGGFHASAGDAAGLNKEAARLVRFES